MKSLLQEYLLQKGILPLPGLGLMTMEEAEASYDERATMLNPPETKLQFSKQGSEADIPLQPLMSHLAVQLEINEEDAYDALHSYVHQVLMEIDAKGVYDWAPWGQWKKENGSDITWVPLQAKAVFFPVQAVKHLSRAIHLETPETSIPLAAEKTDFQEEEETQAGAIDRWWILPLVVGIIAIAAIIWARLL